VKAGSTVKKLLLEAGQRGTQVIYWLSPVVTWKPETISNKGVNLARYISRQNAENANWLILALASYDKAFLENGALKKKERKNGSVFDQNLETLYSYFLL
jgi:hypothetical protein